MRAVLTVFVLLSLSAHAQQPAPKEKSFIRQLVETRSFNYGRPAAIRIAPDEKTVFFLRSPPESNVMTLFSFDVATGETKELLTPESLLKGAEETLTVQEKARRERMRVGTRGFTTYALSEDGTKLLVSLSGRLFAVDRTSLKVTELKAGAGALDPRFSLDGKQVAFVRDNDVYRVDLATNMEHAVTRGGTAEKAHGVAEFVAQEEMGRLEGYWWSPDAKAIAFTEVDTREVEKLAILDALHPEQAPESFAFPRVGKANAKVRLGIAPVSGGATVWVKWDAAKYPYLATVKWPRKGPLTLLVQNRAQTEEVLLAVDPKTGRTRTLHVEKDEAWLNLDQSFPHWLEDGSGFLWLTERNGGPEVELRDANGGRVRTLVAPEAGFRTLVRQADATSTLYFLGGPNPTERYLWAVKDGGTPVRVTTGGPGLEGGTVSRDGGLLVVPNESPTRLRRFPVLKADGTPVGILPSVALEPPFQARLEVRQVGARKYWASIVRPRDSKPGVKLPVIVQVYGGPLVTVVHQGLGPHLLSQWWADQGFIIVSFDGRGTPLRGREWERVLKHDLFGVTLDDQVEALKALAAEVPEMDLTRVGIEGWSFGGDMAALGVIQRPDVFKAAVAGAACAEQKDYDTHYTERYLGLIDEHPEAYEKSSLLTYIREDKPIGKLLLVHGTADDNVYFYHSLKLSDALFRAGKPHEFLPIGGATHSISDPLLTERLWERIVRHFKENL